MISESVGLVFAVRYETPESDDAPGSVSETSTPSSAADSSLARFPDATVLESR